MKEFQPPERGKSIYILCNLLLLGFLYYSIAFRGVLTVWTAFACGGFSLFNGLWSIDKRLFSWLHRDDPTVSGFRYGYLAFMIAGALFSALGVAAILLI